MNQLSLIPNFGKRLFFVQNFKCSFFALISSNDKKQFFNDQVGPNGLIKVSNSGYTFKFSNRKLSGVLRMVICFLLSSQLELVFGQNPGTINLSSSTLEGDATSGVCGIDGLDVFSINGTTASCGGGCTGTITYLWQSSTNGTSWSSASTTDGSNTNVTYNPPLVTVKTYFRRLFTTPTKDTASNTVIINPITTTTGTVSWAGGRSCIQQDYLTLNSSGLAGTALQWSWQTSAVSSPSSDQCLTCSNSNGWSQVMGSQGGGSGVATSGSWNFVTPAGVYCKRESYAVRTTDSIKCFITSTASESTYSIYRAGLDSTITVSSPQTINLRTTALRNEDNGGSWTRISGSNGTFTTSGDAASYTVVQGSSHMNIFRYINGGSCCPDTSFIYISVAKTLNLDNAIFNVKLKSEDEAELSLKDENIKLGGHFEIERNIQGENTFSKIDEVNLNPAGLSEFKYLDKLPKSAKILYYRIKNVSLDGGVNYTAVKQVSKKIKDLVDYYPSIVSQNMKILVQNESDNANSIQLKIYDMVGRSLKSDNYDLHKGFNSIVLNLTGLIQGNYVMRVVDQTNRINETLRFVKSK